MLIQAITNWGQLISGNCSTQALRACAYHDLTAFIMQQLVCGMQRACPVHPARPATQQLDGRRCPASMSPKLLYVLSLPKGDPELTQARRVTLKVVSIAMHITSLTQHD